MSRRKNKHQAAKQKTAPQNVPIYKYWEWPKEMATQKQLSDPGLRLKPIRGWDCPDGVVQYYDGCLWVYKITDCEPNPLSDAQIAAQAKRKATLAAKDLAERTCKKCSHTYENKKLVCGQCYAAEAAAYLLKSECVIIDVETTGLQIHNSHIIQLALVDHSGQTLISTYIKPPEMIDENSEAFSVNRITNAMVADAPTISEIYAEVINAIGNRRIVAYNASFDYGFIFNVIWKIKFPTMEHPECRWLTEYANWDCLMEIYDAWYGDWSDRYNDYRWQSLDTACEEFQIQRGGHTALGDALAAQQLLVALSSRAVGVSE
jgi:DNA polymerase III subunit epsilon